MMKRIFALTIAGLLGCMLIGTLASVSLADYDYYADRLSREHRIASDVDEWIERGNATITASPIFENGMRLTAWASAHQESDNYEFAIASGVYLFEIPNNAQSIEILVRYKGEPNKFEINDHYEPIAGRVWIRNLKRETTRRGYNDQSASETRYGDTFVLRAKNRSETIKIPVAGHVDRGWMELHIVAEGGEQLDVEYIEVSTYRRAPKVRVIQHYTPTYRWRPWNRYTYLYFYDGPIFYSSGYDSYLCWSYPIYDHNFLTIRSYYGGYLGRYRTYYPSRYVYYHTPHYYHGSYGRVTPVYRKRTQLNRWSAKHESVRKQYSRSRLATPSRTAERTQTQTAVGAVVENHRRQAPPSTERVSRSTIITQKQRASVARLTPQQNDTVRSYSSRTRSSVQTTDRQRRLILNSRSSVTTNRSRTSAINDRSSLYQRRSVSSSNRTNNSSSSRTSSSTIDRTKQRNSTVSSSRSTSTRTESQRVSRTPSSSSRTRTSTSTRTSTPTRTSTSSSSSNDDKDDDDNKTRSRTSTSERSKRRR